MMARFTKVFYVSAEEPYIFAKEPEMSADIRRMYPKIRYHPSLFCCCMDTKGSWQKSWQKCSRYPHKSPTYSQTSPRRPLLRISMALLPVHFVRVVTGLEFFLVNSKKSPVYPEKNPISSQKSPIYPQNKLKWYRVVGWYTSRPCASRRNTFTGVRSPSVHQQNACIYIHKGRYVNICAMQSIHINVGYIYLHL